jgi:hypothetical protein
MQSKEGILKSIQRDDGSVCILGVLSIPCGLVWYFVLSNAANLSSKDKKVCHYLLRHAQWWLGRKISRLADKEYAQNGHVW